VTVSGGFSTYGQIGGIIVLESPVPRIPGDLGHASTFDFPIRFAVPKDFPFIDLVRGDASRLDRAIDAARELENAGVSFVAADCGLFSIFHREIRAALHVPFLSSALMMIPLLQAMLPPRRRVGVLTGHAGMLSDAHLAPFGFAKDAIAVEGMEHGPEFCRVVIDRAQDLDVDAMRKDVIETSARLVKHYPDVGAILLECTNLISFRQDLQLALKRPVYDMLSLVEMVTSGFTLRRFDNRFLAR